MVESEALKKVLEGNVGETDYEEDTKAGTKFVKVESRDADISLKKEGEGEDILYSVDGKEADSERSSDSSDPENHEEEGEK